MELLEAREIINSVDAEMVKLFCKRMHASAEIAKYKEAHGLPVYDAAREKEVIKRNAEAAEPEMRELYCEFITTVMKLSKDYQRTLMGKAEEEQ